MDVDEAKKDVAVEVKVVDPNCQTIIQVHDYISLVAKGVTTKETRYISRAVRALTSLRKKLNGIVLTYVNENVATAKGITLDFERLKEDTKTLDNAESLKSLNWTNLCKDSSLDYAEVACYLQLLNLIYMIHDNQYEKALECADSLVSRVKSKQRRTMDVILAKVYFNYAFIHELMDNSAGIRKELLSAHRTATLRHNNEGVATLMNLILRNYINNKLYQSAVTLVDNCKFPDNVSSNEWARFHYYMGVLKAIQLNYSEANEHLENALRKAPFKSAFGFQQQVSKWLVVVQLLLGRIPNRSIFRREHMQRSLYPYFQITKAVKLGDLVLFNKAIEKYADKFQQVSIYNLIMRCRHNVIKAGVRNICASYTRISLDDVCEKLHLDSPESAEFIIAKAVRDGVVDASIDHVNGYIVSKGMSDIYRTDEPQNEYHRRILSCMKMHNDCVKALRFPDDEFRNELETLDERRAREKQEQELAKELEEEDDDFDDESPL